MLPIELCKACHACASLTRVHHFNHNTDVLPRSCFCGAQVNGQSVYKFHGVHSGCHAETRVLAAQIYKSHLGHISLVSELLQCKWEDFDGASILVNACHFGWLCYLPTCLQHKQLQCRRSTFFLVPRGLL